MQGLAGWWALLSSSGCQSVICMGLLMYGLVRAMAAPLLCSCTALPMLP